MTPTKEILAGMSDEQKTAFTKDWNDGLPYHDMARIHDISGHPWDKVRSLAKRLGLQERVIRFPRAGQQLPPPKPAKRKCLTCQETFQPRWVGLWVCDPCKNSEVFSAGSEYAVSLGGRR